MLVTMRVSTLLRIVAGTVLATFVATLLLLSNAGEDHGLPPGPASPVPETRAFATASVTS